MKTGNNEKNPIVILFEKIVVKALPSVAVVVRVILWHHHSAQGATRQLPARRRTGRRRSRTRAAMMVPHRSARTIPRGASWCTARRLVVIRQGERLGRLFEIAGPTACGIRISEGGADLRIRICVSVRNDVRERGGRRSVAVATGMRGALRVRCEVRL